MREPAILAGALTMKRASMILAAAILAALVTQIPALTGAQVSADVKADYDRANSLNQRIANKMSGEMQGTPTWIAGSQKFWYAKSVKGGNNAREFVLVDPVAPSKGPAFDHARLATSLSTAASGTYTATTLPFTTFTYVDNMQAIDFAIGGGGGGGGRAGGGGAGGRAGGAAPAAGAPAAQRYHCTLTDYACTKLPAPPAAAAAGQGQGGRAGGLAADPNAGPPEQATRPSPDEKWEAYIENYNVFIRPLATTAAGGGGGRQGAGAPGGGGGRQGGNQGVQLSFDGSEGNPYQLPGGRGGGAGGANPTGGPWSPDSQKIAVYRVRPGYNRLVTYVQSSPTDQQQPKTSTISYRKPGDVVDFQQPVLFDVATKKQMVVDSSLFPNPYNNGRIEWKRDSSAFTFQYNQRGHQVLRVIEVDATTGKARTVIDETSKTFIYYNAPSEPISGSGRTYRYDTRDGKEIVWMSQRDNWAHLYLYDRATGQVKNQITKGNWQVHYVDRVDEAKRQIYFRANGMDAGKDPYFVNHFRINFDGTGLVRFTQGDGTHTVYPALNQWAADQQFYVDSYSRVDMPAVTELHRVSDGSLVMPLEKADATDLLATGWRMPEVFVTKGRDNTTDIWGIIIRPTNFDPAKKYPVIENIYAGPQGSFVPKGWSTQAGMMALAELGFIVVQVDGMGTANRSKAFHDVAYQNIGDAGFPDRILWHKAIAAKYPSYDITRVGIYGTSAGGQNATGGVLFHPEFYKVAVSNSGCHDNRMDKIWWNEQWMGWPLGPQYSASSNTDHANKLQGRLMLVVPEMDTNVDPSSTMQVVNALVQAGKEFELVFIPGANHGAGSPITTRKRNDFFVKFLRGLEPPNWNATAVTAGSAGDDVLDETAVWVEGEMWGRDR
jgi:dipeptidyl aminopeptidase/acylaminoacyl peptidase